MSDFELKTERAMHEVGRFLKREAILKAPVDTGILRMNIDYRIEGDTIILVCTSPYAHEMEYGAPPGVDDEESVIKWAERHKIKNPFGTVNYLNEKGVVVGSNKTNNDSDGNTPAVQNPLHVTWQGRNSYRPFLRPAVFGNIDKIIKIFALELAKENS